MPEHAEVRPFLILHDSLFVFCFLFFVFCFFFELLNSCITKKRLSHLTLPSFFVLPHISPSQGTLSFEGSAFENMFRCVHKQSLVRTLVQKCQTQMQHKHSSAEATEAKPEQSTTITAPSQLDAYKRLIRADKSIGTWLLLLPCYWGQLASHGMLLAAQQNLLADSAAVLAKAGVTANTALPLLPLDVMCLFGMGAFLMRSAGCIVNDMWDKDFDSKVERTKTRPIASGEVSMQRAAVYLVGNVGVAGGVLLSLHPSCFGVGVLSLPFVAAYPLFKRFTHLPQLFLGVTFNWGTMVGFASVAHFVSWTVVAPMYLAGISWTMLYDTVYAHQDKADDKRIGVKSTALLFGESKVPLHAFGACTTALLATSGMATGCMSATFLCGGLAGAGVMLHRELHKLDLNNPAACAKFFVVNRTYGLRICLVFFLAAFMFLEESKKGLTSKTTESTKQTSSENEYTRNIWLADNAKLLANVLTLKVPLQQALEKTAWW